MNRRIGKRKRRVTNQEPKASPSANKPAGHEQENSEQPGKKPSASGAEIHTPKTHAKCCKPGDQEKHWLDYATGLFAFLAAVGGLVAGIAGGYQGWVSRDAEIIANRAVLVSNSWSAVTYNDISSKQREWQLTPVIENTGNTPTENLRYISSMGICVNGTPPKEATDRQLDWRRKTDGGFIRNIIGPKSNIATQFLNITNSTFNCPWTGDAVGLVKYSDIFGNPHLLEFCTLIRLPNIDFQSYPTGQTIRIQGFACPYHNCSDNECGSDWKERAMN